MHFQPPAIALLLVRHAATAWNNQKRYQGRQDIPLPADGVADAERLARGLAGVPIGLVLASPLARAMATALPLATATGATLESDARLVELSYGLWEGLTQVEIKARWPDELRCWKRAPETARPPGGESLAEVLARLGDLLGDLPRRAAGRGVVALVTHDIIIRLALLAARGVGPAGLRGITVAPASAHPLLLSGGHLAIPVTEQAAHA